MNIQIVDLRAQHDELRTEIEAALRDAIDSSSFIGGPLVESFERDFADYCGSRHALGCASGTDALKLALMAVGVKPGEAVVTVPNTFIATVEAISLIGAYPVFVDIDPVSFNMSPIRLQEYVETCCYQDGDGRLVDIASGRRVTVVLPVHLYGQSVDMDPIWRIAERYGLKIVEDACQAHGAAYKSSSGEERRAGTLGHAAAFSFYPGKNLGAMGEAGAVTTDDPAMAANVKMWRDHGQSERYIHASSRGWNGRLDALHAAVLAIKLRKLVEWNERRRQVAAWYRELLDRDERIVLPAEAAYAHHVYHLFVVRIPDRDRIREELGKRGISTGLHYPVPLHLQAAYRDMGFQAGDFPEAESAARDILSLPMHPHLTRLEVEYVAGALQESLER